jgi:signal transduction histidine kinase
MTLGTSTRGGIATPCWTRAEHEDDRLLRAAGRIRRRSWLAKGAATLHLLGLGLLFSLGWHDPAAATGATIAGLPALHLGFLMATGAAAALLTLSAREAEPAPAPAIAEQPQAVTGADQLLAQMSHELRTPLNAIIGFSELMLRELYGPLGDARYQEYAAHINESGGRLLKSSEDALAVTETMSAVMAERLGGRRERVLASSLVRESWNAVDAGGRSGRLAMSNCTACDIVCERRATGQALQHLLREAVARTPENGSVEVRGRRRGGARSVEIKVINGPGEAEIPSRNYRPDRSLEAPGSNLRVMLARLLVEMQGATLSLSDDGEGGVWYACVAFPPSS